jgi:hypothetical protein
VSASLQQHEDRQIRNSTIIGNAMWISVSAKEKSNKKERKGMGYAHNLFEGFPRHTHHGIYQGVFILGIHRKMIYSCIINCSTYILFSL